MVRTVSKLLIVEVTVTTGVTVNRLVLRRMDWIVEVQIEVLNKVIILGGTAIAQD